MNLLHPSSVRDLLCDYSRRTSIAIDRRESADYAGTDAGEMQRGESRKGPSASTASILLTLREYGALLFLAVLVLLAGSIAR